VKSNEVSKYLIINADDFGVTSGVNKAIMATHQCGAVTSASIMVNMWAFEEAVEMAKSAPSLAVGLHFTLAAGRPVSSPAKVPTLVNGRGLFHDRSTLLMKLIRRQIPLDEVKRELYAQNEKLEKRGIRADHIDGDQHIHILPGVSRTVVGLARELGSIPVRIPDEQISISLCSLSRPQNGRALLALLLRKFWSKMLKHRLTQQRIVSNSGFISLFGLVPRRIPSIEDIAYLISTVKRGLTEFMVHPGQFDQEYREFFGSESLAKEREVELHLLLSEEFRSLLKKFSIRLTNYEAVHVSENSH
jgi:chitin disaccharide deacetylase